MRWMERDPWRWLCLMGIVSVVFAAVGSNRPFWGYGGIPTSRLPPQGQLLWSAQISPQGQAHGTLLTVPLSWLEWGASYHYIGFADTSVRWSGELGVKMVLPRLNPWQPSLAVGVVDLVEQGRLAENFYFVGGYHFKASPFLLSLDFGALYARHRFTPWDTSSASGVRSFCATELDFGYLSLMGEIFWQNRDFGAMPSLWLKPLRLISGEVGDYLSLGAGAQWNWRGDSFPGVWGGLQVQLPLDRHLDTLRLSDTSAYVSGEPWIWIDLGPFADFAWSDTAREYRLGTQTDVAARLGISGLYWINRFHATAVDRLRTISRLRQRPVWASSALLWNRPVFWGQSWQFSAPFWMVGIVDAGQGGLWIQEQIRRRGWSPAFLEGYYARDYRRRNWVQEGVARFPLHPQLPWLLRWTQFYGEIGRYADGRDRVWGIWQQGERSFLRVAAGYEWKSGFWFWETALQIALGDIFTARVGQIQISAPYVRQRASSAFSERKGWFPVEGNARWRRDNPWSFRRWKGDSLIALKTFADDDDSDADGVSSTEDQCPYRAEDRDGFEDGDGCPDLDNDGDGIADSADACPYRAEDRDGFEDGDGCPDLDNDGDGIADARDLCPNQRGESLWMGCPHGLDRDGDRLNDDMDVCPGSAEDYDGWDDEDGCPDPDNDRDGIPDARDRCPLDPEIMDGILDDDGCP